MTTYKSAVKSCLKLGFFGLVALALFGPTVEASAGPTRLVNVIQKAKVAEKLHIVVYIDDLFTPQERFTVTLGLREWERATNGMITIETRSGWTKEDDFRDVPDRISAIMGRCTKSVHVARMVSEDPIVQKIENEIEQEIDGYANGSCEAKFVLLVTDRNDDDDMLQQTMTHELGHILGLEHIPVPHRTAMYPGDTKCTMCLTELDLIQLCDRKEFNCDVTKLQPCIPAKK